MLPSTITSGGAVNTQNFGFVPFVWYCTAMFHNVHSNKTSTVSFVLLCILVHAKRIGRKFGNMFNKTGPLVCTFLLH